MSRHAINTEAHARAPLFEGVKAFADRRQAPFYSPGHKGGRSMPDEFRLHIAELDLNNLPDTDTLHCPSGAIGEAQDLLADAYGVDRSFILVGGSTEGNIAAIMASLSPGETVLVQRNAHKSVIAGIVHSGAVPVWLSPAIEDSFGIALGLGADEVDAAFVKHPLAKGVIALNPTYFGTVPDIEALAEVSRRHGKLLLADEAHGPHFHFHPELPTAAEDVGASAVVQSTHKVLSGLSQAAVLHVRKADIDPERVQAVLQLIQTTSPSFAIMASIDLARRQMVLEGHARLSATLALARRARSELDALTGVEVLGARHLKGKRSGFFGLDEIKIVLRVDGLGMTGYDVQRALNREFGVQPELGGTAHVLFILTLGNTDEDVDRLVRAMRSLSAGAKPRAHQAPLLGQVQSHHRALIEMSPIVEMTPRDAFFARSKAMPFASSEGKICAEVVTPYPPGIPVLMPGERITRSLVDALTEVRDSGCPISASDPTLVTVKIVA